MIMKPVKSIIISICLFFVFSTVVLAQTGSFSDTSGHWAAQVIERCAEDGLVGGYADGSFKPDAKITRAEFAALINRALGLSTQSSQSFKDVKPADWFAPEIARAVKNGYLKGYKDATMRPNNPVTRQEAAAVIARIMKLAENAGGAAVFADTAQIPDWSKGVVGAVAGAGYMSGYPEGTFQPVRLLTRAEAVSLLDRVVGILYKEPGTYGPSSGTQTVEGNITIRTGGVTLQNMTIKGTLYLAAGIGDGDVTLKNITVIGTTVVAGGGEHSIDAENCQLGDVIIGRKDGKVRIVARNGTVINTAIIQNSASIEYPETVSGALGEVIIMVPEGEEVELNGAFGNVTISSQEANVSITSGSTVEHLQVADTAAGAKVTVTQGAAVTELTVDAPVLVTGQGTINTAIINADGASIDQQPENIVMEEGITATVNDTVVSEGTSSSGGGGGGRTSQIHVDSITAMFNDGDLVEDTSAPFEFDLKNDVLYPGDTLFTGFKIAGNYVSDGCTLVITQLNLANQDWLNEPMQVAVGPGEVVTTRALLNDLDTGELGINLGSLREFGRNLVITGYLERAGYTRCSDITVTLQLSDGGISDLSGVENRWLEFMKSGSTVTGTIKDNQGTVKLSDVSVLDFMWQGEVGVDDGVSGVSWHLGQDAIKAAVARMVGKAWEEITLGDLHEKTLKYRKSIEDPVYTLTIQ